MRISITINFHSVKIEKVLETDNGEILHYEFPSGDLRHETWLNDLDDQVKEQILEQIPASINLISIPQFIAA